MFFVVNCVEILGCFGLFWLFGCSGLLRLFGYFGLFWLFGCSGGVGRVYGYPMKRGAVGERKKGGLIVF